MKIWHLLASWTLLLGQIIPAQSEPATAASVADSQDVSTNQILLSEIRLYRLITLMEKANELPTLWKRRRRFLWAISNSAATEAGLIDATRLFFTHSNYKNELQAKMSDGTTKLSIVGMPRRVSGGADAGQLLPQVLGQEINAGGDFFELSYNMAVRWRNIKNKTAPKQALLIAKGQLALIDLQLRQRQLWEQGNKDAVNAMTLHEHIHETATLQTFRNRLVAEFQRAYIAARREFAYQNSLEVIDLCRNVVGAIGNQTSIRAGYSGNSHLNGFGNLLSEIAAVGITSRPWLALGVAKLAEHQATKRIAKELPVRGASARLQPDEVLSAQTAVAEQDRLMKEGDDLLARTDASTKRRLVYQNIRDTIYGPTKMANSILGIVLGYDDSLAATQKNRLNAAGALTYTIGQGLNLLELSREQVFDEVNEHRLKQTGQTSKQVWARRLTELDEVETKLK